MPQITLDYTNNIKSYIDYRELFHEIHSYLEKTSGIDTNNCKSRLQILDQYFIDQGQQNCAFVHLEVALLEGRPMEIKKKTGSGLLDLLQKFFEPENSNLDIQLTVEIRDMARETYFKFHDDGFNKPG